MIIFQKSQDPLQVSASGDCSQASPNITCHHTLLPCIFFFLKMPDRRLPPIRSAIPVSVVEICFSCNITTTVAPETSESWLKAMCTSAELLSL